MLGEGFKQIFSRLMSFFLRAKLFMLQLRQPHPLMKRKIPKPLEEKRKIMQKARRNTNINI